ncbi:MAG: hypothetical protein JWP72_2191 [Massilia sp.]|jgi:hypothetical protein|nr:hypothetical protein [Massilia sp.]MDB5792402.1 hypothetical protein [Massilia sp.]
MPSYDYETLFEHILGAVAARGTIGQRMHTVIDECERQLPHADWERMRRIDFDGDLPVLNGWLADAWLGGAVRPGDQGLWFGLFSTGGEDGTVIYDMFVASGPSYDDRSDAWRSEIVHDDLSYLDSVVLAELCSLAHASKYGLGHDAEYPLTLAYGAIAACTALAQEPLPLELTALRGAAAGFDSGDALFIGVFDNLRFIQQVRAM